jgi:hypothetical protein
MKKSMVFSLVAGLALLLPSLAAAQSYGSAGCGLGSLAFKENGKWQQVLAATTNGTFGSQTFGITTGTSNCAQDGVVLKQKEREVFVAANTETLKTEMAKGTGENLIVLAHLFGCSDDSTSGFAKATKDNYAAKISDANTAGALIDAVTDVVASDADLKTACQ